MHSYQVGRWHQTGATSWYVQAGLPCREVGGMGQKHCAEGCTPVSWAFFVYFFFNKKPLVDAFYSKLLKTRQHILRKKNSLSTSFRKLPLSTKLSTYVFACWYNATELAKIGRNFLNAKFQNDKTIKNDLRTHGFVVKYLPANNPYKMCYWLP